MRASERPFPEKEPDALQLERLLLHRYCAAAAFLFSGAGPFSQQQNNNKKGGNI